MDKSDLRLRRLAQAAGGTILAAKALGALKKSPNEDVPGGAAGGDVRPAGPQEANEDRSEWSEVEETSDESFPASDPPARY